MYNQSKSKILSRWIIKHTAMLSTILLAIVILIGLIEFILIKKTYAEPTANNPDWATQLSAFSSSVYTLITFIGTIFIIQTFRQQKKTNDNQIVFNREQAKINDSQLKINDLAIKKHIREMRPFFMIYLTEEGNFLSFDLLYTPAKIKYFTIHANHSSIQNPEVQNAFFLPGKGIFKISIDTLGNIPNDGLKRPSIVIDFYDEEGRSYQQSVSNQDGKFNIGWPNFIRGLPGETGDEYSISLEQN